MYDVRVAQPPSRISRRQRMSVTQVSCHARGGNSIAAVAIAVVQRLLFMVLLAVAWAAPARAQQRDLAPDADQTASSPAADRYLRYIPDIDQGGGFHLTKHLAVVFGDIKDGSGVALGPAVSAK